MIVEKSWAKFTPKQEKRLCRLIWNGSGHNLEAASIASCTGIMESHYVLPPDKDYNNYRGHFGTHNGTLLAVIKRRKIGGTKEMWLAYWKKDPFMADYYGAAQMAYLLRVYNSPRRTLKQWVVGSTSKPSEIRRGEIYAYNVLKLQEKYFGNR